MRENNYAFVDGNNFTGVAVNKSTGLMAGTVVAHSRSVETLG